MTRRPGSTPSKNSIPAPCGAIRSCCAWRSPAVITLVTFRPVADRRQHGTGLVHRHRLALALADGDLLHLCRGAGRGARQGPGRHPCARSRTDVTAKRLATPISADATPTVGASQLRKGDLILVEASEMIAGDGEVVAGAALVNESAVTGESAPVVRESGGDRSAVTGGTTVIASTIIVRITANPGETFLDRMIGLIEGAKRRKTPNEVALEVLLIALTLVFLLVCANISPLSIYSVAGRRPGHAGVADRPGGALRLPGPHHHRRPAAGHRHRRHGPALPEERHRPVRPGHRGGRRRQRAAARQDRHHHPRQPGGGGLCPGGRPHGAGTGRGGPDGLAGRRDPGRAQRGDPGQAEVWSDAGSTTGRMPKWSRSAPTPVSPGSISGGKQYRKGAADSIDRLCQQAGRHAIPADLEGAVDRHRPGRGHAAGGLLRVPRSSG